MVTAMSENRIANTNNSKEALAEVWADYQSRLYRKAFRHLGCREDAEDAVQDALLCALKGIGWFRGEANLSTWLYSIVINSARGIMRQRLRRDVLSLDEQCWGEDHTWADLLVDSRPGQDDIYVGTELSETFDALLQRLPAAQRQVYSLRTRDGLSLKEIAERLGIPEGTAKARFSRGRAKLLRLMNRTRISSLPRATSGASTTPTRTGAAVAL
jgi:RNA polymerase sigma-70 factor, ECF subfamily